MQWELDHVFFACSDAGAVEQTLSAFGISFTGRRVHRGQGTGNACANFENAYFELLFPAEDEEFQFEVVRPLGLKERMHSTAFFRLGGASSGLVARFHALVHEYAFVMMNRAPLSKQLQLTVMDKVPEAERGRAAAELRR